MPHVAKARSMGEVGGGSVTHLIANKSDQGTQIALGMHVDKIKKNRKELNRLNKKTQQ